MSAPKNVVILGATGSIGTSALKVIRLHPDRLRLLGIAGNSRFEELAAIAQEFEVPHCCLFDESAREDARRAGAFPESSGLTAGMDGLVELATLEEADLVLVAVVGTDALLPTLRAIEAGKAIALANKEILVMAGEIVMNTARRTGSVLLPTDSEHNAIFQCLAGAANSQSDVEKLILTASGGPFRDCSREEMKAVTVEEALDHPNWDMGPKVTIDSATMANKGLELIEARWLFDMPVERLGVVVHPQSIIHSMVQYVDGSILAQLSPPSMTFPIQYCLLYPDRHQGVDATLDFEEAIRLDLRPPDHERFPCLALARQALASGGLFPCAFNAANEVAVEAFVAGKIGFLQIPWVIDKSLESTSSREPSSLDAVHQGDREARETASRLIDSL